MKIIKTNLQLKNFFVRLFGDKEILDLYSVLEEKIAAYKAVKLCKENSDF